MGKYRILIVDDEEALRYGLQTYLDMEGYDTDSVSSAEEALSLNLSEYDLILLDIMMSGMSGTDMAKIMKQNPVTADIPVIFLTAKDSDNDMVSGLNIGADDYIAKPYSIKMFWQGLPQCYAGVSQSRFRILYATAQHLCALSMGRLSAFRGRNLNY